MKTVIIVQARMTSTRLPGKVLMDLAGRPMLAQQLRRLQQCRGVDEIVIATTTNPTDDPVCALAKEHGVRACRGSEHDVLSRYAGAAHETGADVVVRITSDCPLIDPEISARVIEELTSHPGCDYVNNVSPRSYPRGLDTEAFTRETLDKMDRLATSQAAREHVTLFAVMEQPEMFVRRSVTDDEDNSDLRWTVDTPEDLSMMRRIYEGLRLAEHIAPYREVLAFVRAHPEISALNARVQQKSV